MCTGERGGGGEGMVSRVDNVDRAWLGNEWQQVAGPPISYLPNFTVSTPIPYLQGEGRRDIEGEKEK